MVEAMKSVRLNNARIEHLVDQLYGLNRRLVAAEGKLLRLAEARGVKRQDFLNHHIGYELAPDWVQRVRRLHGKGWSGLINKHGTEVKTLRAEIATIAERGGRCRRSNSAASSRPCSAASARPAAPRRRWSRPICASSSRSPRNTPIAACNSST